MAPMLLFLLASAVPPAPRQRVVIVEAGGDIGQATCTAVEMAHADEHSAVESSLPPLP